LEITAILHSIHALSEIARLRESAAAHALYPACHRRTRRQGQALRVASQSASERIPPAPSHGSRSLTPARGDGLLAIKTFCWSNRPTAGFVSKASW